MMIKAANRWQIRLATGTGPSGLTIGPFCGAVAAGLALGERPPLDLSPYAPARVAAAA